MSHEEKDQVADLCLRAGQRSNATLMLQVDT
jgi:hypothetical protein